MSENPKTEDIQPSPVLKQRGLLSNFLRFILFVVIVISAFAIGAEFEPIKSQIQDTIASLTNSRLPDSSSRLQYSLTSPRDLVFQFDQQTTEVDLQWSKSEWRPRNPSDSGFGYEVSVYAPDMTRITSIWSDKSALSIGNLAGYLGQYLTITIQAAGTVRIGDHEYDFQSEMGEFTWIVPAATATPTPTSTPSEYTDKYANQYADQHAIEYTDKHSNQYSDETANR